MGYREFIDLFLYLLVVKETFPKKYGNLLKVKL